MTDTEIIWSEDLTPSDGDDRVYRFLVELKATLADGIDRYFRIQKERRIEEGKASKISTERALSLAFVSLLIGLIVTQGEGLNSIGLVRVGQFILTLGSLVWFAVFFVLGWLFIHTLILSLPEGSALYRVFSRVINYPLPFLVAVLILGYLIPQLVSPFEPVEIPPDVLGILSLIATVILAVVIAYVVGKRRRPLMPKLSIELQPWLVTIPVDGREFRANIRNTTTGEIKGIHVEIRVPSGLQIGEAEDSMKGILVRDFDLPGGKVHPVFGMIAAAEAAFQGKEEKIAVTVSAPSVGLEETLEATAVF